MAELNRLEIISTEEHAELLGAALALHVPHGWEEEDIPAGVVARVHSPNREFCEELEATLRTMQPEWKITFAVVPEEDWVSTWKEFFTPVQAGSRFLVLAPWMHDERKATTRQPVIIEPKTAFGTGHHATTALCLTALSDLFDAGRVKAGQSFLDLGTGSGILGIGAALLGLKGIGVDPDLMAVENAVENRAINTVAEENFVVRRGSLEAVPEQGFDLVMANILAEPLMNMATQIVGKVKK
ncbi:50S ribosomal protein L11 methyltransferase, partial [Desulfovibrio sp. OttesenSCG-928-F07]|nr:50S ribosomal protein L11 methyltransferase [Desulfovibrio sp. OttesenSCG-928-F07]